MVDEKSGGYNKFGLVLALLAFYEFYTRPFSTQIPLIKRKISHAPSSAKSPTVTQWLIPAVALGSLMFCLHFFLSDPGTLLAWSWTGFQNGRANGPVVNIHGSLTIIAQSVGISVPVILPSVTLKRIHFLEHPLWFVYGVANSIVMYKYRNWLGYVGGLQLSLFLMSIIPLTLQRAAQAGNVGKTYFTAMLVYCVLSLGSVWTVAYAFVPAGVYLRERTDV